MAETLKTSRLLAVLLGGLLAFGCSSGSGDDDDASDDGTTDDGTTDDGGDGSTYEGTPVITITSPERGTITPLDSVEVSGTVTGSSAITSLTVNGGTAQVDADGRFSVNLTLGQGLTIIETVARDDQGRESTDARGVLAGNLVEQATPVTEGLVANLSGTAMGGLATMIQDLASNTDFTAIATGLNPVAETGGGGCLSATVNVNSVQHGEISVGASPVAGGMAASVTVRDLVITGRANFRVACVGGGADFTITASSFDLTGTINPTLDATNINVALNGVNNSFSSFNLDVDGLPEFLVDLLNGTVRDQLQNILRDTITGMVPTLANDFLSEFLADSFSIDLLGQTISLSVAPSSMNWTEQGGTIVLDTSSTVDGADALYLSSPRPRPADADLASTGLRIAVADDVLNQLFASVQASGALDMTVLPLPGDILSAAFGGEVEAASITMILPPVANFDTTTGTAKLTVADLQMDAVGPGGEILASFVLSAEIELAVETRSDGGVRIVTRAPRIVAQILSQSEDLLTELTPDKVTAIAELGITQVSLLADDLLGSIPVPGLAGATITSPTFQPVGGYLMVGGDITFTP